MIDAKELDTSFIITLVILRYSLRLGHPLFQSLLRLPKLVPFTVMEYIVL